MIKNLFVVACIPAYKEEEYIGDVISNAMKYVDKVLVCARGVGLILITTAIILWTLVNLIREKK